MMEKRHTIALLTDFGDMDSYVAEVKGVILSINSNANIIDITHKIEPQDILHASLMLKRSVYFFPRETTFLCIVDPDVGTSRGIIFIETDNYNFIAPDNGLLWLTANELDVNRVVKLENHNYFISSAPSTFEGRDKMAPVAAYSSLGVEPTQFGSIQNGIVHLGLPETIIENDLLIGEIIYFDNFGNAITNITFENLMENEAVNLPDVYFNSHKVGHIVSTFSDVNNGTPVAYFGSSGFLELAINRGDFRSAMQAKTHDKVTVRYGKK